jgi:hypothetical protein
MSCSFPSYIVNIFTRMAIFGTYDKKCIVERGLNNRLSVTKPLQAVQYLPEHYVSVGDMLRVTADHDTYSISFRITPKDPHTYQGEPASATPSLIVNENPTSSSPSSSSSAAAEAAAKAATATSLAAAPPSALSTAACEVIVMEGPVGQEGEAANLVASAPVGQDIAGACQEGAVAAAAATTGVAVATKAPRPTSIPLVDPVWHMGAAATAQLHELLSKAAASHPRDLRELWAAAVTLVTHVPEASHLEQDQSDTRSTSSTGISKRGDMYSSSSTSTGQTSRNASTTGFGGGSTALSRVNGGDQSREASLEEGTQQQRGREGTVVSVQSETLPDARLINTARSFLARLMR